MNQLESEWIGEQLRTLPDEAIFPLINVGSSTHQFRTQTQPYIERNIFEPLRARSESVYHVDMKSAPGVDLVGDLLDLKFFQEIAKLRPRSAILSNILEHVTVRQPICD